MLVTAGNTDAYRVKIDIIVLIEDTDTDILKIRAAAVLVITAVILLF